MYSFTYFLHTYMHTYLLTSQNLHAATCPVAVHTNPCPYRGTFGALIEPFARKCRVPACQRHTSRQGIAPGTERHALALASMCVSECACESNEHLLTYYLPIYLTCKVWVVDRYGWDGTLCAVWGNSLVSEYNYLHCFPTAATLVPKPV